MERATAQIARTGRFHAVRRAAAVPLAQRPTRHILIRNRLGITRHLSSPALLTDPRTRTATIRHELSSLNVLRLGQSLVYIGLAFSPAGMGWPQLGWPAFARTLATVYLIFALVALLLHRRSMSYVRTAVAVTLVVDIAAAMMAIAAMHDA